MKNLICTATIFLAGTGALASDKMTNQVVCHKPYVAGEADNGLSVILKSNKTSWKNLVQVFEDGYLGHRMIANVQVPLQPQIVEAPRTRNQVDLIYEADELTLSIRAFKNLSTYVLTGSGSIELRLSRFGSETVELHCKDVSSN